MITVTPRIVLVSGPLARSSLTIAMADEGDRATRITPVSSAIASRTGTPRSFITGNQPERTYMAIAPSPNVATTRPTVTQAMLRNWERISLNTSSLPAASAMMARAIWLTKPRSSTSGRSRIFRMSGPARQPAKRYPVIRGNRQRELNLPNRSAASTMTVNTSTVEISLSSASENSYINNRTEREEMTPVAVTGCPNPPPCGKVNSTRFRPIPVIR